MHRLALRDEMRRPLPAFFPNQEAIPSITGLLLYRRYR